MKIFELVSEVTCIHGTSPNPGVGLVEAREGYTYFGFSLPFSGSQITWFEVCSWLVLNALCCSTTLSGFSGTDLEELGVMSFEWPSCG